MSEEKTLEDVARVELETHIETWARNCGAPKDVYVGHLDRLLSAVRAAEREACARLASGWNTAGRNVGRPIAGAIRARLEREAEG